jgi:hypothetical protein
MSDEVIRDAAKRVAEWPQWKREEHCGGLTGHGPWLAAERDGWVCARCGKRCTVRKTTSAPQSQSNPSPS